MPDALLPGMIAATAAFGFAFSTSLQHQAAGGVPDQIANPFALLFRLLLRPRWVLGSSIGLTSWFLHAVALNHGTLSLVQPIILLGVVMAVFVRSALEHSRPNRHEVVGVAITITSLIIFVGVVDTDMSDQPPSGRAAAIVVLVAVAIAAVVTAAVNRLHHRAQAARILGSTAGMLFGVTAVLMKLTGEAISESGVPGFLGHWAPYALVTCGIIALALNQRAYQLSRLADSMPILNVTSVLVSILLGALLFHEQLPTEPWVWAVQAVGLAGIALGLRRIAEGEEESDASHASDQTLS